MTWKSPLSAKFSAISRPYFHLQLLGFARIVSDVGDTWWRELKFSNHWSSKLGGLTCRWQRHSVETFLLRILNDSWAGQNPLGLQCRLKKKKKKKKKKLYSQLKGLPERISLQMECAAPNNVKLATADSFQIFTHPRSKNISL